MMNNFIVNELRGEHGVIQNQSQQHAQADLHAEQGADADENEAGFKAEGEAVQADPVDMPAEVELGGNPAGAIAQAGNEHAQQTGDAHGLGLFHAFGAVGIHGLDRFARGHVGGKA